MKCQTKGCKNKARKGRTLCCTCQNKKYKEKYPLKYLYYTQRANAMRRGKEHTLTLEEFIAFCMETSYHLFKGRTALSLSIDRINPWKGYTKDNIRAITLSENSSLGVKEDYEEELPF